MNILNTAYEMVDSSTLVLHPKNPRQGNSASINESIESNGFYGALVVQKSTRRVLAGNHRLKEAKALGAEQVPVIWVDCDDDKAVKILLADNRSNDMAGYDDSMLIEVLQGLTNDYSGTLYDQETYNKLVKGVEKAATAANEFAVEAESKALPENFQILIICYDEAQQFSLLERFSSEGVKCRALIS